MKRPNNLLIILAVMFLSLGGFWAWQNGFFDKLFKKSEPNNNIAEEKGKSSLRGSIPQIVEKQINEETEDYSVEIKYPSVIGLADTMASEEISRYFKEKAEKDADDFKKDAAENAVKEAGVQSQLISGYQAFWYDASFLSFKTETMSYVEGMAHPSTYDSVFNYDINGRKQLYLNDFFNTGSAYLEILSIKAKEEVKRQLGEDYDEFMAREGTAPKKENYENFLFDKDGLTFIFGQYQVAQSAAGIVYVKILYSDMAEFNSQSEIIKKITAK